MVWRRMVLAVVLVVGAATGLRSADKDTAGWVELFNGKDTTGWRLRDEKVTTTKYVDADGKVIPGARKEKGKIVGKSGKEIPGAKAVKETVPNTSGWTVKDGVLTSTHPHHGNDLVSLQKFTDFELHVEFLGTSNSGVYLQGRYEIQIDNSFGRKPQKRKIDGKEVMSLDPHQCGAIYGRIAPSKNMAKKPMEWQTYDVIFHGARGTKGKVTQKARVTLVWNGEKVIDNAEIAGATGGALDGNVTQPGPIFLQGDHGKVSFRNVRIKPLAGK